MNDPLSPLTAPPPRYLLESDSSDEEGQGHYPSVGEPSRRVRTAAVSHAYTVIPTSTKTYTSVIAGIGQAGRYVARVLGVDASRPGQVQLKDSDATVGQGYEHGGSLLLLLEESGAAGEGGFELSEAIFGRFEARQWLILTTYLPALYIPDPIERTTAEDDPPIRYLAAQTDEVLKKSGIQKLTSPNYLIGIAAALASLAAHPASPIPQDTPLTVLSLPLPLSSLNRETLLEALAVLLQTQTSSQTDNGSQWHEEDDEPYVGIGQGVVKATNRAAREEIDLSMYT